jgi:hypothetical protein
MNRVSKEIDPSLSPFATRPHDGNFPITKSVVIAPAAAKIARPAPAPCQEVFKHVFQERLQSLTPEAASSHA